MITSVLVISLKDNICFSTFGVRQPSTKTAGLRHWVMSNISNFGRSEKVNLPQTFPCKNPFEFCSLKLEKKTLIEWIDLNLIAGDLAPVNQLGRSLYWCFHCKCLEYTIDYDYVEAFHDVYVIDVVTTSVIEINKQGTIGKELTSKMDENEWTSWLKELTIEGHRAPSAQKGDEKQQAGNIWGEGKWIIYHIMKLFVCTL